MSRRRLRSAPPAAGRRTHPAPAIRRRLATLALAIAPLRGLAAQPAHEALLRERFQAELQRLADGFDGVAGLHIVDVAGGHRFDVRGDWVFPQASAIKVLLLLELFRRAESEPALRRERVTLTAANRTEGSGVLQVLTDGGSALSLEDHAIYMIVHSDNTSTNILIDRLGMDAVNALADALGAPGARFRRRMIQPEASARGDENIATPRDAAAIMTRLATCDLPMSRAACERVGQILALPKGGPTRRAVPDDVLVAYKPGGLPGVVTTWAVVRLPGREYVLAVMTNYGGGDGNGFVEAVGRAAYAHFSKLAGVTPHGTRVPLDVLRRAGRPPG
jgi:beta-lactamase class A